MIEARGGLLQALLCVQPGSKSNSTTLCLGRGAQVLLVADLEISVPDTVAQPFTVAVLVTGHSR